MQLLVRNRVRDAGVWLRFFEEDLERGAASGLSVAAVWQDESDPNNIFFLLDVADRQRAEAFMAEPASAAMGEHAGVIDGEFYFLEAMPRGAPQGDESK